MGIKCSLLGHRFTETDVTEEREEEGSEVVITIREIETCERCGAERIVSENKEVTALETADGDAVDAEPADEPDADHASGPSPSTGTDAAPDMTAAEDDAELLDADADTDATETAEPGPATPAADPEPAPGPTADAGAEPEPEPSAAEDDAVILDDGDDEPAREPGEWPDEAEAEEDADAEPATEEAPGEAWPDEAESGPAESESPTADMEWPDEGAESAGDEWEPSESLTQKIDQAEVEPAGSATVTVPEGEFECPECGFRTSVESTSLRAGDFCPECHRGSLEHVPEGETRKE
jgi:hypothetical protein